jgi:isopenicillin-N N-acyltransferase-like protein
VPPYTENENDPGATVAMVIMQPKKGLMEVAPFPALNNDFKAYRLEIEDSKF